MNYVFEGSFSFRFPGSVDFTCMIGASKQNQIPYMYLLLTAYFLKTLIFEFTHIHLKNSCVYLEYSVSNLARSSFLRILPETAFGIASMKNTFLIRL